MTTTRLVGDTTVLIDGPGDDSAASTIVMLHGWPDTAALWEPTVAALRDRWRCVRFSWPGFEPRADGQADTSRVHSFDELLARCGAVIDAVSPDTPVTLLMHDWGCFYGYQYALRQPARVARVIGIDVGDTGSPDHRAELSARELGGIIVYQLWLAVAWRLRRSVGQAMTRLACKVLKVRTPIEQVRADMNYPYYSTWTGGYRDARRAVRRIACPTLYLWGERKPFQFHSVAWVNELKARPGCDARPLPSGHWVMVDQPQAFHSTVRDWLAATEATVATVTADAASTPPAAQA